MSKKLQSTSPLPENTSLNSKSLRLKQEQHSIEDKPVEEPKSKEVMENQKDQVLKIIQKKASLRITMMIKSMLMLKNPQRNP